MINSASRILNIILYGIIFCILFSSCNNYDVSESQTEKFVKYYPTDFFYYSEGTDLIQASDGGYLVAGTTFKTDGTISDREIMVIMTDEYGRQKDHSPILTGTTGHDFGYKIVPAGDGYLIAGSSKQGSTTYGFLVKISLTGERVWEQTYGTTPLQEFLGITECSDGGFILTGYSKETSGDRQVYLVKTDIYGFPVWERVIGFTGYNDIGEVLVENNSRIIIAGTTTPVNTASGNSRLLILNTNSEGKGMTEHRIEVDGDLSAADMAVDGEDNVIILGNNDDPVSDLSELYLARIKLEGLNNELITVLNATPVDFPESLYGESLVINTDNSLMICGWQEKQDNRDILFVRMNQNFTVKDIQLFGSTGYQSGASISPTDDGGYVITGGAEVAGNINTILIKLGPDGKLN